MGLAMETAVVFIFRNFCYTFGGKKFVQLSGGPIGARITMAVARLVMQNWKDKYNQILKASKIEEILSGLYVDDSRGMHRKLRYGERYCPTENRFIVDEKLEVIDREETMNLDELTRVDV